MILGNLSTFWWLIPLCILIIWFYYKQNKKILGFKFNYIFNYKTPINNILIHSSKILRILIIINLLIAILRPQKTNIDREYSATGIDIILAIDISGSMRAKDFKPNRFNAAKNVIKEFINNRKTDRIGLVAFAGEAYTVCPLTLDYDMLNTFLDKLTPGKIKDGTAIGDGLGVAINCLKHAKGKSKIIILLTDGENNSGTIPPNLAAKWADETNIKIYTIAVGSEKGDKVPVIDAYGRILGYTITKVDKNLLRKIAENTNGRFFMATSIKKLEEIYKEIDEMEKTKYNVKIYYNYIDKYRIFLWLALILMILLYIREEVILIIP